jgi:clan AA aspartic protease (TIGR02281 family)
VPPPARERRARRWLGAFGILAVVILGPSASAQFRWRDDRPVGDVARALTPPDAPRAPEAATRAGVPARHHIPLSGGATHLIVHGTLNDVLSGPMLIDTGSSYCVLTRKTAQRLGVRPVVGATVAVATANGEVEADLVRLDSIQVEDARLGGVEAVVIDAVEPPLVGIIGLSFLNQFRRYSVDHARGTIQLER